MVVNYILPSYSSPGGKERVCFLNDEITVSPGTMRATGDWVIVKDGQMYYLGRKDNQIKRHGKRVNLESIQLVISYFINLLL